MPSYKPQGVCSSQIDFEIDEEGLIRNVRFADGCDGNSEGVSRLAEGRPASELVELLSGVSCGRRPTSCPDQLAQAINAHLNASADTPPAP